MSDYYTNRGNVRGRCGHKHRTLSGAARCLRSDQRGCRGQGGYSDRITVRVSGGEAVGLTEAETAELGYQLDRCPALI